MPQFKQHVDSLRALALGFLCFFAALPLDFVMAQGVDGPVPEAQSSAIEVEFQAWLAGVAEEAMATGLKPEIIDAALGSARLNLAV